MLSKYEEFSFKRKELIRIGEAPEWYSTAGFQLISNKNYLLVGETPRNMYERLARRAAELTEFTIPADYGYTNWYNAFFDVLWKGWLSPSTPVLSNLGTDRGMSVSCSGSIAEDSIDGFYSLRKELALLTKEGFGTSAILDLIRHRGSPTSKGGVASGVTQLAKGIVQDMKDVSQGGVRRGSAGLYLNILHEDFDEVADQLIADNEDWNIGWNITDAFEELFEKDPIEADRRWKKALKVKLLTGKGYFFFLDKANRHSPQMYKDRGFTIKGSQLCTEISLMCDKDHSFTCVLSSLNVSKYDEWKDTKAVEIATVFLDAIISDMLEKTEGIEAFKKVTAFTKKSRALGLGILGLSTYYQMQGWIFGDMQSTLFNQQLFKMLDDRTYKVSSMIAAEVGEPEWLIGYGQRFSHRLAVAPTMSTSIIMGGVSEGIMPVVANAFEADTAGGTVFRINPVLLKLMKERGVYNKETMGRIESDNGSVQGEDWLSDHEKKVFRTAFELSQKDIVRMASQRQVYIDQAQSLNLYFQADAKEEYVSEVHDIAFKDPNILSLYYIRTLNKAGKVKIEIADCESCDG